MPQELPKHVEELFDAMTDRFRKRIVQLQQELNQLVGDHHAQAGQELQNAGQPGKLPWFKYGLRGFLSKLWYGNHPDNPVWSYHTQAHECVSLDYYAYIQEQLKPAAELMFFEAAVEAGATPKTTEVEDEEKAHAEQLKTLLKNFYADLVEIMRQYTNELLRSGEEEAPENPAPTASPSPAPPAETSARSTARAEAGEMPLKGTPTATISPRRKKTPAPPAPPEIPPDDFLNRYKMGPKNKFYVKPEDLHKPFVNVPECMRGQPAHVLREYYRMLLKLQA